MKKPTIYDIKYGSDGHFFSRDTLKFFKQRLKDFWVILYDEKEKLWLTEAPRPYGFSRHIWKEEPFGVFTLLGTLEGYENKSCTSRAPAVL